MTVNVVAALVVGEVVAWSVCLTAAAWWAWRDRRAAKAGER